MSDTNFMSYDNAQSVLGGFANAIKGKDDPYTTISYADWLNLTDQEKESGKYYITGAPGADGSIQVDLMTKLWENPSPSASFEAQNVNISTSGYDFVMILAKWNKDDNQVQAFWGKVGSNPIVIYFGLASANGSRTMQRHVSIFDTTKIAFDNAIDAVGTTSSTTNNNRCIPISIYGIKTTQTIKLNAIASDVSTSADKCMLSDGVTSVEDRIDAHILDYMTTIDGYTSNNRFLCPSDGYIRINARSGSTLYLYLSNNSTTGGVLMLGVASATEQNIMVLYVKAGMYAYVTDKSGTVEAVFIPLS